MSRYDRHRNAHQSGGKQVPPEKIIAWIKNNFEYRTRKDGQEYQICDPFDYDTRFRFNINPHLGACHSWHGDEWAGPINPKTGKRNCSFIKFVSIYRQYSFRDALREVLGTAQDATEFLRRGDSRGSSESQERVSVSLPEGVSLIAGATDNHARLVSQWLRRRGYTNADIAKHHLHYGGMTVYWPYFEFGDMVYWQSRSRIEKRFQFPDVHVYDEKGNIVAETEGSKGDFLYGFDDAAPASYLILTEAIFDQHTLDEQALAMGGAILTQQQIKKIRMLGPRHGIILAPDNDIAGYKSVIANKRLLEREGFKVFASFPPAATYAKGGETHKVKDFNELYTGCKLSREEIRELFDNNIKRITNRDIIKLRRSMYDPVTGVSR